MEIPRGNNFLFRQQFLMGPQQFDISEFWKNLEITQSLVVTYHPDLEITQCTKDEKSLTLMGYFLDPSQPHQNNREILEMLLSENVDLDGLVRSTSDLCGNWILICKQLDDAFLFHDCTGARSIFYSDGDKEKGVWFSSQPRLIAHVLELKEDKNAIQFITSQKSKTSDYWWPGEKTPYAEIKALLPNHYFDLKRGKVFRYWPTGNLARMPKDEAVEKVSKRLKGVMQAAAQRFDLALALSCGLDSRVMLAASKDIRKKICIYNVKRPEMSSKHPDVLIPKRIASELKLEFHFIPQSCEVDAEFHEAFHLNAPHPFAEIFPGIQAEFKYFNLTKVGTTGNILETARFFYNQTRDAIPDGESLASITRMKDHSFAIEAFQDWLNKVNDHFNVNIYDLFYWEQRCGRWLSNGCLVFLMAWKDVFFPFNCRNLLVDLLSVPEIHRIPGDYPFFVDVARTMWPEVLSEPINPIQKKNVASKFIRKAQNILRSIKHRA